MEQPRKLDTFYRMDASMEIGIVSLAVTDLERSLSFYEDVLGFTLLARSGNSAVLGGERPLVLLTECKGAPRCPEYTTGLYHLALLLPGRVDLACALRHLFECGYPLQGSADHNISEAIYLSDPDGNGIELYRDRPRSAWPWQHGKLEATEPSIQLNVESLLAELDGTEFTWRGLSPFTRVGHVHLKVGNLAQSAAFYQGVLGLYETITGISGACFFAAGGYHHHIGCNVWTSLDAPSPSLNAPGLRFFTLALTERMQVMSLASHISNTGIMVEQHQQSYLLRDPANNGILLTGETLRESEEVMALADIFS